MSCRVTVKGATSSISGNCSGNFVSHTTPDGFHIEVDDCIIDVKCKDNECVRTIKCPGVQPLIGSHEWNKRYTFAFKPS